MVEQNPEDSFSLSRRQAQKLELELRALLEKFSAGDESKGARIARSVIAKYSEKQRFYHDLSHVAALLERAKNFKEKFADYESVRLAVWFHDAVYDPQSASNETESAALAVGNLAELNFPSSTIRKVERMILATRRHDPTGLDADGKLFLDLDLSILGAEPAVYRKYARLIRREYSFVPDEIYRRKRREILQNFLARKVIYYAGEMRELFENNARANIANEIKELS